MKRLGCCAANENLGWIQVSCLLSVDSSASAYTTPAVSHATAAAQALTRSHGAPQPSTAPMSVIVSVHVQWLIQCVNKTTLCYSPRRWLLESRPPEWTEVSSRLWYLSPVVDALIWYCREPQWRVERVFLLWYVWWTAQCTTTSRITAFCHCGQLVSRLARPPPAYQIVPHASLSASHPVNQQSLFQLESNCFGLLTNFSLHETWPCSSHKSRKRKMKKTSKPFSALMQWKCTLTIHKH